MALITREDVERLAGIRIQDITLYQKAFIHKPCLRDNITNITESYELSEFVGDSVIGFIVATYLVKKFPGKNEGFLTRVRTKIVNGETLARFSKEMGLQKYIIMNQRAMLQNWNGNQRILEDVFEAFVGAIYNDVGLKFAKKFIIDTIEKYIDFNVTLLDTNFKDTLMRYTQGIAIPLPEYRMVEDRNDQNQKIFTIHVYVNGIGRGAGVGTNKKQAEQAAAKHALITIGLYNSDNPNIID